MITCQNCKNIEIFNLKLTWIYEEKHCEKCNNAEYFTKTYHFCSHKCLTEWLKKAENCMKLNIHEWKPDIPNASDYSPIKGGKITVSEHCQICDMQRFVKH